MIEPTNREQTPRKLDKRAKGAMEFAIYKAEEKGDRRSKQIEDAAAALRKEQPNIPPDEALIHATEMYERLADKQKKRTQHNEKRRKENEKRRKEKVQADRTRHFAVLHEQRRREELNVPSIRTGFLRCGNCRHEIHHSAKPCPHCSCPWPRRDNWRICSACSEQTPIYVRRKYTRINKWDKITHCAHCGKRESHVDNGAPIDFNLSPDEITQAYQGGVIFLVVVALILFWIFL